MFIVIKGQNKAVNTDNVSYFSVHGHVLQFNYYHNKDPLRIYYEDRQQAKAAYLKILEYLSNNELMLYDAEVEDID